MRLLQTIVHKLESPEEMDQLPETYTLLKMNHEEIKKSEQIYD